MRSSLPPATGTANRSYPTKMWALVDACCQVFTVALCANRRYQCMLAAFLTAWFSSQMSDSDGDYDLPQFCIQQVAPPQVAQPQVAPPQSSSTSFPYDPACGSLFDPEDSDGDEEDATALQPNAAAEPREQASRESV